MKMKMKKILAAIVAVSMVAAMAVTVSAEASGNDAEVSVASEATVTIEDDITGIKITGSADIDGAALQAIGSMTSTTCGWDVQLLNGGSNVDPADEVTLTLLLPTNFRGVALTGTVKHTLADGSTEMLPFENAGTYMTDEFVVVKTNSLGHFETGYSDGTEANVTESSTETEESAPAVGEDAAATADKESPATGVQGVAALAISAAVAGAAVIISKKRK